MPRYIHCISTRTSSYFHSMPHIDYCITCTTSSTSHTQANTGTLTAPKCGHEWEAHGDVRPYHQTPRETTNGHRSCSKAKDLPQADGQKRRPGCSRTAWHRGCPVKAAQGRRWHDRKDDDTKTTAVRDGPHEYRPHSLHYHLSSPTSD